jgi:hypothetical protein
MINKSSAAAVQVLPQTTQPDSTSRYVRAIRIGTGTNRQSALLPAGAAVASMSVLVMLLNSRNKSRRSQPPKQAAMLLPQQLC